MTPETNSANSCPLCSKDNNCGNLVGVPQGACWCSKEKFPPQIFGQIPRDQLNRSCICKSCLEKFK
ncbi:cysteine-rich CWC family protein [Cohnella silvisoli]|uniref:Cysteine-rich CWC family protein n=1 Tax=Cohnella silvisoli TaxID=2873699 RepID=A0ABV1L015_9BACL|nr:cysteine-rich CWC family protein [Cohnella silvisoli]MCD9024967.1 cysteine-rich CWC family protein [Cohnella silvisoli]